MTPVRLPLFLAAIAAAFLALWAGPALAQSTTGSLRGVVLDQSDQPMGGVALRLTCDCLQGERSAETGSDGSFRFLSLPPGDYKLETSKEGFKTIIRTNLQVALGRTVTITLVMELPEVGETIEIIDRRPLIDTESNTGSITLNSDFLQNLPTGRSFQEAVQFLPGVTGGANPNINGGTANSNQYYLDGASTTDPVTGTFSMNFNFDAIEDLQVITSGYDARYDQGLGGTINIVTKSGGNTFEGNFSGYYETSSLQGTGDRYTNVARSDLQSVEVNGSLGGPIVKDRFWFFLSYRYTNQRFLTGSTLDIGRDYGLYPLQPYRWQSHYFIGKLTASPFARNKFTLTFRTDPTSIDNVNATDIFSLPEAMSWWKQGGFSVSLQHELQIGVRAVLETQAFYQYSDIFEQPMLWKDCKERDENQLCTEADKLTPLTAPAGGFGLVHGSSGSYDFDRRHNLQIQTNLGISLDRLLGSHSVDVGLGVNPMWTLRNVGYAGNQVLLKNPVDADGDGELGQAEISDIDSYENVQRIVAVPNLRTRTPGVSAFGYLSERWTPTRGLTLNAGVRWRYTNLKNNVGDDVINQHTFNWGAGLNWDPFRDGKTSIRAGYAQLASPGLLMLSGYINQNTFSTQERYNWDPEQQRWSEDSARAQTPGSNLFHHDFATPRSHEISVVVSREIARDLSGQLDFVYRKFTNQWEDDEVNLVWNEDGTDVVGYRNGSAGEVYRLRTPQDGLRNYWGLTLTVRKQLSDNFELLGSYTFSRLTANVAGRGFGDTLGTSSDFDNPTQRWHEDGVAASDQPHVFKLAASYDNPNIWKISEKFSMGYALGGAMDLRSGVPLDRREFNVWNQGYSNYVTKRGTQERMPARADIDLRASLALKIGPTQVDLIVQAFNIINSLQPTAADNRAIDGEGDVVEGSLGPAYARVAGFQTPRRFEFGLRFTF